MINWFQIKEKSAGKKRLLLSWYLYNKMGKSAVLFIGFWVALITFIFNKDLRYYSHKYFEILFAYTKNKKHKPSVINSFKHVLSYSNSLIDKMEVFGGNFNPDNIIFDNKNDEDILFSDIKNKRGIFFICSHIGNVEILRALFNRNNHIKTPNISVFLQRNQCEIFNDFINGLSEVNVNITTYPVEDIDITTGVEISNKLEQGEIVFMAGDRVSANNSDKNIQGVILNQKIELPSGVFRLVKHFNAEIYFVSCLKEKENYRVYLSKNTGKSDINVLKENYQQFLNTLILRYPYQFYNFYDYFMLK